MLNKCKILLYIAINGSIIILGMYLKHDFKVILGCLFAGNILIAGIYLYRIIGGTKWKNFLFY